MEVAFALPRGSFVVNGPGSSVTLNSAGYEARSSSRTFVVRVVVDWVVLVGTMVVLVAAATVVGSVLSVVAGFELGGTVEMAGVTAVVASVPLVVDWVPPKRPKINGRR